MNNKPLICFDLYSQLTVPAIKGGAIESLITILIEENEKNGKLNFTVISRYDKNAKEISKKYKNTKIIYIKDNLIAQKIYDKGIFLLNKLMKCVCRKELTIRYYTYYKIRRLLILNKIDAFKTIIFGPDEIYRSFVKKKGLDNTIFYLHYKEHATELSDSIVYNVIGVSNYIINKYLENSKNNNISGKVLLNRVDENRFTKKLTCKEKNEFRKELGLDEKDFVVIYAGRIHREKGIHVLVDAIKQISKKNIKMIICGGVSANDEASLNYYKEIEENIKNDDKRILVTGYIDNNELYRYYQISDIQVVPSLCEEAAGNIIIEGMLSGLPLIVTRAGGIPEYVNEKCAFILDRDEKLSLHIKEKIELLYSNIELRNNMREASLINAKEFSKADYYKEFVELVTNM